MGSDGNESMDASKKGDHIRPTYLSHCVINIVQWDLQECMFQGPRELMD